MLDLFSLLLIIAVSFVDHVLLKGLKFEFLGGLI